MSMFTTYLNASGADVAPADGVKTSGGEFGAHSLVFEVRAGGGGWTGAVKIAGRALGAGQSGATDYPGYVALTNRTTGATIAGATGATAAGLYEADVSGLEVAVEHAWDAGTVTVIGRVVNY